MTNRYLRGYNRRKLLIKPHGYTPPVLNFISHIAEENPTLYYGIEFETEYATKSKAKAEKHLRKLSQFLKGRERTWFMETDCSIDGYELVSHPITMKAWEENTDAIKSLCCSARKAGFDNKNDKAGLHIHASRKGLGKDEDERIIVAGRIAYIIDKFYDCFMKIGQRKQCFYCYRPNTDINNWDDDNSAAIKAHNACCDHYAALNDENEDTVEFRFFSSTTNPERVLGYIQLVDTLIDYAKKHTFEQLTRMNDITRILDSDKKALNKIIDEFVESKVKLNTLTGM